MVGNERVFIIIDGSNFYHRLKELGLKNLLSFNYRAFTQFLIGQRPLISNNYYIGAIREERNNPKSKELILAQVKGFRPWQRVKFYVKSLWFMKDKKSPATEIWKFISARIRPQ